MSAMLKFKDNDLKKGLLNSIVRFKSCNNKHLYIGIDEIGVECYTDNLDDMIKYVESIKCLGENYTSKEFEVLGFCAEDSEYIITNQENVKVYFDEAESMIETTLGELIDLVQNAEQATIDDDGICISGNLVILRVIPEDFLFESLYEFPEFEKTITYQNKSVTFTTSSYSELYYLKVFFDDTFNYFNPVILGDDLFVEIYFEKNSNINTESIMEIFNAYIFEIFVTYGYKLTLNPRSLLKYEPDVIDEIDTSKFVLSPLLFSKGMKDVLMLFNGAEGYNEDRAIVEYVKVIEYISVTVIRKNVTIEAQKKLLEIKSVTPSADYIKELGDIFINHSKKLKSDSDMIKATIKECCDVEMLNRYSPKFIKSLFNLKKDIAADNSNKQNLLNQASNDLAQSISDTRNNISHAKANYQNRGYECPDNQKKDFIILLRNVCVQVISWFYNTDESIRIIKEVVE